MSEMGSGEKETCRQLMMAALDGEISPKERRLLDELLQKYPDLSEEFTEFSSLKEVTKDMKLREPEQEIWQTYWINVYNRLERGLAWLVLTIGASMLIAFGLYSMIQEVWLDSTMSIFVKIGIYGLTLGSVLLLISIGREKIFLWRHERYREVQR